MASDSTLNAIPDRAAMRAFAEQVFSEASGVDYDTAQTLCNYIFDLTGDRPRPGEAATPAPLTFEEWWTTYAPSEPHGWAPMVYLDLGQSVYAAALAGWQARQPEVDRLHSERSTLAALLDGFDWSCQSPVMHDDFTDDSTDEGWYRCGRCAACRVDAFVNAHLPAQAQEPGGDG